MSTQGETWPFSILASDSKLRGCDVGTRSSVRRCAKEDWVPSSVRAHRPNPRGYRRTGNLRAVQLLLGHTKIESTVRYLGIEVDDALAIAEQVDV